MSNLRVRSRRPRFEFIERRLLFAVGNVDTTFGANGYSVIASPELGFSDVELMSGDRIVATGQFTSPQGRFEFGVVRWTANGALDTTFSSDGIATADFLPPGNNNDASIPGRVAVQSDGKIVVAGTIFDSSTIAGVVSAASSLGLARFNTNGTLDTTFDSDGMSTIAFPGGVTVKQTDTLTDGKIEVFGDYSPTEGTFALFMARFTASGAPDTTFGGGDGWVNIPRLPDGLEAIDSEILPDGKVVVISGGGVDGLRVFRFSPDGTPDSTFAGDGRGDYFVGSWDAAADLAIDADGKIVIAGRIVANDTSFGAITRINTDGTIDTTFGVEGLATGRKGTFDDISLAANGDINLGGGFIRSLVYRYTADGVPVSGYATGVQAGDPDHFDFNTIATQSTGKVILAGFWFADPNANASDLAMARLSETTTPFDDGTQGTATVLGTNGPDVVTVTTSGNSFNVVLNGVTTTYLSAAYSTLSFVGLGGDDSLTVSSSLNVTADCGDGNDTVNTASGADSITGGAGDDSISAGDGPNRITGGDGDDTIASGAGNDSVQGGVGADSISAGGGTDTMTGGAGNDTIDCGDGVDFAYGDDGNDSLIGGDGDDRLFGLAGFDSLYGGAGKDKLYGGANGDLLSGGGGKDKIAGEGSHDRLYGGEGDDQLDGGGGNDRIDAGSGNDKLFAGLGTNHLDGGDGDDFAQGDRLIDEILHTESGD